MVRALVGTMVEIGFGRISLAEFANIIEAKDRKKAAANAPANGLFLTEVGFPEELLVPISSLNVSFL
jgi:tRNA pseudouridine38-40 synthase